VRVTPLIANLDAANILKPALSRGEIVCIGATTHEEYHKAIAQDAALERRFRTITIEEPSAEDTLTILTQVQGHYSAHHNVQNQQRCAASRSDAFGQVHD